MKKYLFGILLLLVAVGGYAQEKLFDEAIRRGKLPYGGYMVENTAKKAVTVEQMRDYIRKKGYNIAGYTTQYLHRFGSVREIVEKMEFISTQDYPQYVYWACSGGNADYNQMKTGTLFFPLTEKKYNHEEYIVKNFDVDFIFSRKDNVRWTGSLSNGLLHGEGRGFFISPGNEYTYFEGTFKYGFPVNDTETYVVTKDPTKTIGRLTESDRKTGKKMWHLNPSMLAHNAKTTDQKLKQAINQYVSQTYSSDASKLETLYNKAKSVNTSNYKSFTADKHVDVFISLYGETNYDPRNLLPKARAIKDVYKVIDALNMPIRERYYGCNSAWSIFRYLYGYVDWLEDEVKGDRGMLSKALSIARQVKANDKYGFKVFCTNAIALIERKSRELESKISKDYVAYKRHNEQNAEENRRLTEQLSKEFDGERTKAPSGEYITPSIFGPTYGRYRNPGEIHFKWGSEYVRYQNYYNENHSLHHCEILDASSKISNRLKKRYFDSVPELFQAVVDAVR